MLAPIGEEPVTAGFATLREFAQRLAGDAAWAGPAGRAAAELIAALEAAAGAGPQTITAAAFALDPAPADGRGSRSAPQGGHPRLSIWGLIEAQLQHADLMILGGLNEGAWPAAPAPDPWLAPRIRHELGLPGDRARDRLAAPRLAGALGGLRGAGDAGAPRRRAPAIASRFWLRLDAHDRRSDAGGAARPARAGDRPADGADQARRAPRADAAGRRSPAPDRGDQARSAQADPFAFYADAMLRLPALDAIDADPSPAWRGSAVHAVFEA